ncbi:MAG TPA: ABC transporter permease [Candidatus Nanoarchaeia archaeon]|nr:ABC transporter permease [Candidatus Nanoarchaeia archaeon]
MIADYFKMAWISISHRKVRSYLTIIGIFIGISAVVSLVSLGNGLNAAIEDELEKIGGDKLFISSKSAIFMGESPNPLKEDDMKVVESVRGVMEVAAYPFNTARIEHKREQILYYVAALPDEKNQRDLFLETAQAEIIDGRLLRSGEKFKALVASDYLDKNVFERPLKSGDVIEINDYEFEIAGVVKTSDESSGVDRMIFLNKDAYETAIGKSDEFQYILAQVASNEDIERVSNDIERALRRHRGLDEGEEDFEVQTPLQLVSAFAAIFNIVQAVVIGIAAISLLVGAVGIANTMYTSVVERTKDIGVMKAIGATNEQIMGLFLVESGMLGLVGGIVGITIGVLIGKMIQYASSAALGVTLIRAEFPLSLIFGALAFAFVLGAVSGMLPALAAAKLKPVDAMRFK